MPLIVHSMAGLSTRFCAVDPSQALRCSHMHFDKVESAGEFIAETK